METKWWENPITKKEMLERMKKGYKEKLKTDITLQFKLEPKYKTWRKEVYNYYNGICAKCGEFVVVPSITFKGKTFRQMFKFYNINTLEEALSSDDLFNMDNSVLQCNTCYKVKRNKRG